MTRLATLVNTFSFFNLFDVIISIFLDLGSFILSHEIFGRSCDCHVFDITVTRILRRIGVKNVLHLDSMVILSNDKAIKALPLATKGTHANPVSSSSCKTLSKFLNNSSSRGEGYLFKISVTPLMINPRGSSYFSGGFKVKATSTKIFRNTGTNDEYSKARVTKISTNIEHVFFRAQPALYQVRFVKTLANLFRHLSHDKLSTM